MRLFTLSFIVLLAVLGAPIAAHAGLHVILGRTGRPVPRHNQR